MINFSVSLSRTATQKVYMFFSFIPCLMRTRNPVAGKGPPGKRNDKNEKLQREEAVCTNENDKHQVLLPLNGSQEKARKHKMSPYPQPIHFRGQHKDPQLVILSVVHVFPPPPRRPFSCHGCRF